MSSALPEGWSENSISEIGEMFNGLSGKSGIDFGIGSPFITYVQVFNDKINHKELNGYVSILDGEMQNNLRYGDIIFTTSSETAEEVGYTSVFLRDDYSPYLNSFCFGIRPYNFDIVLPRFAKYLFRSQEYRLLMRPIAQGTTRFNISKEQVKKLKLPIPPLPEQEKIAAVLGAVDDVIEKTAMQIKKLNDLKKSTMNELLTKGIGHTHFKPSELGQIPKSWDVFRLQDLCHISHGFPFLGEYFSNIPNDNILLTPGNFSVSGGLYYGKKTKYYTGLIPDEYILQNGDVVVVMTDLTKEMAILGNAEIVNHHRKILHNQRIGKLSLYSDKLTKDFAKIIINSDKIKNGVRSTATGTTVRHTSPTKILDNFFAMPPLPEQKHIASILDSISAQIEKVENKLSSLNALKKSLMQDLLSGKVRVRV